MCRILYVNNPMAMGFRWLYKTITNLTLDGGGDGIGLGFFVNGEPVIHKSKDITVMSAAKIMAGLNCPVLFHTRAASEGTETTDLECHPFITKDGIFCHNGGVRSLISVAKRSDTHIIKEMINHLGFDKTAKTMHSYGVFALLQRDGSLKWKAGAPRNENSRRFFTEMRWIKAGQDIIIGISNPDCMNDSWLQAREYRLRKEAELCDDLDELYDDPDADDYWDCQDTEDDKWGGNVVPIGNKAIKEVST